MEVKQKLQELLQAGRLGRKIYIGVMATIQESKYWIKRQKITTMIFCCTDTKKTSPWKI